MSESAPAPFLSVVIPTRGRPILIDTIGSLLRTAWHDRLEIIVVGAIMDDAVRRQIETAVEEHGLRHIDVQFETGDSSRKKNRGAEESRADLIAFLDDDVIVPGDWPERITEAFADEAVGLVSGPGRVPDDLPLMGRLAGLALTSRASGYVADRYRGAAHGAIPVQWSGIIGCNMVYRRSVFEGIDGFAADFWPGEEMLASYRAQQAGAGLRFVPDAPVDHYPRQSVGSFWTQIFGYGATRIRLFRAGVAFEPSTLVPMAWVASLVVLGILSIWFRWARWLLLADVASYAIVDLVVALQMMKQTGKAKDLLLVFMIPVMHTSYGLASWVEFFRPGRDLSEAPVDGAGG